LSVAPATGAAAGGYDIVIEGQDFIAPRVVFGGVVATGGGQRSKAVRLPRVLLVLFTRRATNLSLSADVLDAARELGINISRECDTHLRELVRREQERRWREQHAAFIDAYNRTVAEQGLPLDEWRSF
jgi:antitoxin CcdA